MGLLVTSCDASLCRDYSSDAVRKAGYKNAVTVNIIQALKHSLVLWPGLVDVWKSLMQFSSLSMLCNDYFY